MKTILISLKKSFLLFTICFISILTMLFITNDTTMAQSTMVPLAGNNLSISGTSESSMIATSTGYSRIFSIDNKVYVEDYNKNFILQKRRTIKTELSYYGGFYNGNDAYYFAFGRNNESENTSREVIRIVKYSKSWKRLGAACLTGDSEFAHEIRYPFWAGTLNMAEYKGTLYLVTGHQGYVDASVGMGHQGFLMYAINETTMKGRIVDADLWHSFSQYIRIKDSNNIFVLEQSEGSRQAQLTKKTSSDLYGTTIPILEYGGSRDSVWALATYASVDGMELSSNNILTVGTSIDQSKYDSHSYTMPQNIYITVTPINNFTTKATSLKWITKDKTNKSYYGVKLTKINSNRFLLTWESSSESYSDNSSHIDELSNHKLHYLFLDGNGKSVSKVFTVNAAISECDPIIKGSKAVFYSSDEDTVIFYAINTKTGSFVKKTYRIAGKNAVWNYSKGVLTISGKGAMSSSFNASTLGSIKSKIKKIVVKKGITSINANAFPYLENCTYAIIENGVTSIGKSAFYGNKNLTKVIIPVSVTKIGKGAFDTGWYWGGSMNPLYSATIYCTNGSYAKKYADKCGIQHSMIGISVSLDKKTYRYTGKSIKPQLNVRDSSKKIISKKYYSVSYKNNKKTGTATVTLKFKGRYSGTVKKTFKIKK